MQTVSSPASFSIPAGYVESACMECGAAIAVPFGNPFPCCESCKRSNAQAEAMRLLADAKDLRDGRGIFAGLTADERQEQLRQLVISTGDGKPVAPLDQSLRELVNVLSDSAVDALADHVARRISQRTRKPGRTLVQIAIADLSDEGLIEVIGVNNDPIILNAASAELTRRLGNLSDAFALPIYVAEAGSEPDAATRFELEGRIEHPLAGDHFDSAFAG